ncbi:hypothetical protein AAG570_013857 [Ranatra chinensis]|uniref:Uncharacterized protein n=1 Tax=Ranatra chinensis TaxID=642074 RepID=A0ABD0YVW8_9HEMI
MANPALGKIAKTSRTLMLANRAKLLQYRSLFDHRKHFQPEDLKWQWEVRKNSAILYPDPCLTKKCPKKTWLPKFRKEYVLKDVESCKKKPDKPMTWKEYFSYLLPEESQKPRPPILSCRRLWELSKEKCKDPLSSECQEGAVEWPGQVKVRELVSCFQTPLASARAAPCPPPAHIEPRTVLVKKGICVSKGKTPPCLRGYAVQFPDDGLLKARKRAAADLAAEKTFSLKRRRICRPNIPVSHEKTDRLSCRRYAEFKQVDCPPQLYTRYRSVGVGGPRLGPTEAGSAPPSARAFSTQRGGAKDEKGKKKPPICSGCAGIKAAEEEDESAPKPPINCKMRASGKCPPPRNPRGPDDPPISNPYWDNKGRSLSPCNQPRPPDCPPPPPPPMPCDKTRRKYHSSASSRYLNQSSLSVNSGRSLMSTLPDEPKEGGTKFPKFDPFNVKRESCYPKFPKKKDEKVEEPPPPERPPASCPPRGILCRIAGALGIGKCGRKRQS